MPTNKENMCPFKTLYTNVPGSNIYNSQKVEKKTQMLISRCMDYTYNGILFTIYFSTEIHEVLACAMAWMNLEIMMLREESIHKDHILCDSNNTVRFA